MKKGITNTGHLSVKHYCGEQYHHSIYTVADRPEVLVRMGIASVANNRMGLSIPRLLERRVRADGSVVVKFFANRVIAQDHRFHTAMQRVITGAKLPDWKPPKPKGRATAVKTGVSTVEADDYAGCPPKLLVAIKAFVRSREPEKLKAATELVDRILTFRGLNRGEELRRPDDNEWEGQ